LEVSVPARAVSTALASVVAFVALVVAAPAAAAVDAGSSLRISFLPQKTFRGQPATLSIVVRPAGTRCTASVVYADGRKQKLPATKAKRGRATWKWTVPLEVRLGAATVSVGCGRAGSASRVFVVAGKPTEPARVEIEKHGFSQRVTRTGSREVSYGIVLANVSPDNDALDVRLHVNMLDATNTVRRTTTSRVGVVGAKGRYYFGDSASIPEGVPVSTLEIQVRIGSQQPKALWQPQLSDYRIVPSGYDPGWVAGVYFEALNDQPLHVLSRSTTSAVIFDAAGNVLGGGTGQAFTALAPGMRAQFDASRGFSAIPFDRAASAGVSVLGKYTRDT
jgi:hypothetical protein